MSVTLIDGFFGNSCCPAKTAVGIPFGGAISAAGATRWDAADAAIIAAFNPKSLEVSA
jgi:hypothetical protein